MQLSTGTGNCEVYSEGLDNMKKLFVLLLFPEDPSLHDGSGVSGTPNQDVKCLSAISETSWLWHRRLGHMHMEHLKDISNKELVRGLPKIKFEKDKTFAITSHGFVWTNPYY
ncbi:hypothetical protein RJ640_016219 [Escallonia rubra]|uniref:GAG-pre-integrase domain-containing protein n=1 Tax=Escallonia rubra TaxID=112253 RepID=A0AA88QFJ0_9ASTE|nr:hypothetical protein RJ640_016219 [Escallonia rubra]